MSIISIITMIILISALILVHELGHFFAAKAFGVRVSRFALGLPFGPVLYRRKFGETEFLIHSFLLGGYVAFPDDAEQGAEAEAAEEEQLPMDSPLRFKNKKPWQQAIIVSAGVIANVVFALFLVFATALHYQKLPSGNSEVFIQAFDTSKEGSNIIQAGAKAGDRILSVNGIDVNSSYKFIFMVQKSKFFDGFADKKIIDEKLEQLKTLNKGLGEEDIIKAGKTIILPAETPEEPLSISKEVASGYEKYKTDEIKLTDKEKTIRNEARGQTKAVLKEDANLKEIAAAISDSYKPLTIKLLRDGKEIELRNIHTNKDGLLGVKLETREIFIETKNVKDAIKASLAYIYDNTRLMLFGLKQLGTGKIPMSEMHGIVAITKIGGEIIQHRGLLDGLLLTAIISIDLAIINVLPIPALDGGHLMFLFIEKIRGRKLDEQTLERINNVFFFALILLMLFIVFNDVLGIITKKF